MATYQNITIASLLLILVSCSGHNIKETHPYRPKGRTKKVATRKTKIIRRRRKVRFLRDRYNLCTHKRILRSAKYRYNQVVARGIKYGSDVSQERDKYKKIIIDVGKRTREEEKQFFTDYNRPLNCTKEEMRAINI